MKVNSTSKDFFGVVQQNYYAWRDQEVEAVENHDALTEEELAERVAGDPAGLATKEELGVNCGLIYLKLAASLSCGTTYAGSPSDAPWWT